MNLAIDIGNTLQKVAVFNNSDECAYSQSFHVITKEILDTIINKFSIKNSIISTVAGLDELVLEFLEEKTNLLNYSHRTKLPITILYKSAKTLGLDRIANAVGAAALFPCKNVLSIQVGTCLVLDFVNENGEYLGGSISPGVQMRLAVLHEKTKNLPLLSVPAEPQLFLGTNSEGAIMSGVINGICYEIDGFIEDYRRKFKDIAILITGGDAICVQKSIKNTIFAAPNVVLTGLNEIIKYNV